MDEKRSEIIERACTVFMRYGIKTITMDDLSRELAISKKTIYRYFEDKNDLVKSIIGFKIEMDKAICERCKREEGNAIETLINISKFAAEHISNINPTVFYDLKKYHPEAWRLMEQHKYHFILDNIRENILRGMKEGLYRDNINAEVVARMYVVSTDIIMSGEIFPWPEFKVDTVFMEMLRFHIRGLASDKGLNYLKETFNCEIHE